MPGYGQALYNEQAYGEGFDNVVFFLARLIESLPPPYRPTDFRGFNVREFLERMLLPTAEDLDRINGIIELLDTYVVPESAPENWLRWILTEWFGWTLIPDGYPLNPRIPGPIDSGPCLRRLLRNLHLHYQRRYTRIGIRELLKEFGVIAQVYDGPIYYGSYYGSFGSRHPLHVRVRILGYEPIEFPRRTFYGGYYGGYFYHSSRPIVTEPFVIALCNWSRVAGVRFLEEWVTSPTHILESTETIPDDDSIILG